MELTFEKKIGRHTYIFRVEGKSPQELVMEKEKFSFGDIEKCGLCQSDTLDLRAYVTKDGIPYVKIQCYNRECGGSLTFGRPKKSPDTIYPRRTEDGKLDWQPRQEEPEKK